MIRLPKGKADSRWYWFLTVFPFVVQSGESGYLRELLKVIHIEHDKPDKPHTWKWNGILTVRKREGFSRYGMLEKANVGQ